MDPALYIVPTPIGNLGDITLRALEVLKLADLVVAEDTRITRSLLTKLGIKTPKLQSYHDYSQQNVIDLILSRISLGQTVALVCDAGTPVISDPGYRLILAAHKAKSKVIPIPGPCAAIVALSASGLPTDRFLFEGFLPERRNARLKRLDSLRTERATLVFYEAPHRLKDTLVDCIETFGANRRAFLGRELTKLHETILLSTLSELQSFVREDSNQIRGELVLLVSGSRETASTLPPELSRLAQDLSEYLSKKRVATVLSQYSGLSKKQIYDHLVNLKAL